MGLTSKSTGAGVMDSGMRIQRMAGERVVALAGNPNVGKSTVFNALTGMNQHTGNWPGKTVSNAVGACEFHGEKFILVDIPGTYSLMAHSAEEEVARDFICFGEPDAVIVLCDATCLERNLNLALQTLEITPKTVVAVNLLDEAAKKKILIDLEVLEKRLGVPVVGMAARSGQGLEDLMAAVQKICANPQQEVFCVNYPPEIEEAVNFLALMVSTKVGERLNPRWTATKLLDGNQTLMDSMNSYLGFDILEGGIAEAVDTAKSYLQENGVEGTALIDHMVSAVIKTAESIAFEAVTFQKDDYYERDRKIDRVLTNRWLGVPIMAALLGVIFWITLTGANYPSRLLSEGLFWLGDRLHDFFGYIGAPGWLDGMVVDGIYRVLAWVVSVMLPPMAIFFPLFTLLEDLGYLPRVAFNLDKHFKKACACGKQALTMCMGFGCNAAGVTGCRIIDSPRERLIAILTNNFVPCNGRFPTIIAIITMFFAGIAASPGQSMLSALFLTGVIVLGVATTFLISRLLSETVLKGIPSGFTLELPPYRRPQIGKVLVRSLFDRTLFVLGRAVVVAAPAGLILWLLANISVGDVSLLSHCAQFLDPFARFIGLDGVILLAFILGFPANEIVVPIIIMAYMAQGKIMELSSLTELKDLFVQNGWTAMTAVCVILFSLFHWPCSTTCMTIHKETQSVKWTLLSIFLPTAVGVIVCGAVANLVRLFSMAIV